MKFLIMLFSMTVFAQDIYQIKLKKLNGDEFSLSSLKNKVLLVVNTASGCGYTPQLDGLQKIYTRYKDKGLEILGVPSNDFNQEALEGEELAKFCKINYGVKFPILEKMSVTGEKKNPLHNYLVKQDIKNGEVRWNFEKFLVGKDGKLIRRYRSSTSPLDEGFIKDIESALN